MKMEESVLVGVMGEKGITRPVTVNTWVIVNTKNKKIVYDSRELEHVTSVAAKRLA